MSKRFHVYAKLINKYTYIADYETLKRARECNKKNQEKNKAGRQRSRAGYILDTETGNVLNNWFAV